MTRMVVEPVLQGGIRGQDARDIEQFARQVTGFFDRYPAEVSVTAGAEVSNVVTITVQVRDRKLRKVERAMLVEFWVATTATGVPGGVQSVALTTGTMIQTLAANQHYRVRTDATGTAVFTVTITGAATRHVGAVVLGEIVDSGPIAWT